MTGTRVTFYVLDADDPGARLAFGCRLAELQTRIAAGSFVLVERLLQNAFKEMEAALFDEVVSRLRHELPDLIDQVLREHFDRHD
jgi:hypothetical protein